MPCRQGCYGSGEASYPALLPLLTLLPEGVTTDAHSVCQLLEAVIWGCTILAGDSSSNSRALDEAIASYVECWFFLILKVYLESVAILCPVPNFLVLSCGSKSKVTHPAVPNLHHFAMSTYAPQAQSTDSDLVQTLAKSLLADRLLWMALQSGERLSGAALKLMVMTAALPGPASPAGMHLLVLVSEICPALWGSSLGKNKSTEYFADQPPHSHDYCNLTWLLQ